VGAPDLDVVTGSFGYTGRYITERLLASGRGVRTLTGHPNRPNPFGERVSVVRYEFEDRGKLAEILTGASTLYNTYWVRFPRGESTFDRAVQNTKILIEAAVDAGVRRMVHISITNPSHDSPFPYFRGKAAIEDAIRDSGLSHAIIRPTVIFGKEDILINNIAYLLRRLPVFGIPGSGSYRLRPVSVEDVADICVAAGSRDGDEVIDAVGPEIFTFEELVRLIAATIAQQEVGLAVAVEVGRGGHEPAPVDRRDHADAAVVRAVHQPDRDGAGRTAGDGWPRRRREGCRPAQRRLLRQAPQPEARSDRPPGWTGSGRRPAARTR